MPGPVGFRGAPDTFAGKVVGLHGYHVSNQPPTDQQALIWDGTAFEWRGQTQASGGLSGMTAGQIPVAATGTTVSSSLPLSGASGATEVASATSAAKTSGHLASWDTNGNLVDGGAIPAGSTPANPTATISGSAVNGTATTFMRSDAAPALATTAVTAGSYTNTNLTVDANGRLTAASSGTAPADSVTGGISAAGTNSQSAATALTSQFNVVTTVAANSGVALPAVSSGIHCKVRNSGANALQVWPVNGGTAAINAQSANTSISVPVNTSAYFESDGTNWYTIP